MSVRPYGNYKTSGIEWLVDLPSHWHARKVRWLCEIRKRIAGELGYDVLSITQQGIKVRDTESNDGQLSMDYSKYQFVEIGDFAMNHMDLLTGFVDISPFRGVTSPDYRVFAARDLDISHDRYLLYVFQMGYKSRIFFAYGQGSSQLGRWRFPTDQFKEFLLPLPPIDEQRAIVDFADRETAKIDELVNEQRRLIDTLKLKRRAIISDAVTGKTGDSISTKPSEIPWLGAIPTHWNVLPLKRDLAFVTSGSRGWAENYADEGDLFIRIANLTRETIGLDLSDIQRVAVTDSTEGSRTKIQADDVLFSITAYLGSVAVVPEMQETAYVSQHVALARLLHERFTSKWVGYVALSAVGQTWFQLQSYGGTKIQLSLDDVRNLPIPAPPINEQIAIVERLEAELLALEALRTDIERSIGLLQERRTALIFAAVTGQIDVRAQALGGAA